MKSKILTIVVPVYKVERYIRKCLDSCLLYEYGGVLNRSLMDALEVIIVNDGTPDQSAEISREYTKKYPDTFRQIDKENGGHGSAWNVGLKEAKGKYIRFLDSDDWLTNLDELLKVLQTVDVDVVFTDYVCVNETTRDEEYKKLDCPHDIVSNLTKEMLLSQYQGSFILNFWHTTYKTSILQPQWPLFEEKVMYDDSILCEAALLYGRNYIYKQIPVYNYLVGRPGQSMDPRVIAKNAISYHRCFERQVLWRKKAFEHNIPEDLKECISLSIQIYARLVFPYIIGLPYSEAKRLAPRYYNEGYFIPGVSPRKRVKLFKLLPFCMYYYMDKFLNYINYR